MINKTFLELIFLAVFLPICTYSYGQQPIQGKIVDVSGIPVAGARIYILHPGTRAVLKTQAVDTQGFYKMVTEDTISIVLQATAVGYASQERVVVNADRGRDINFILARLQTLGEVIITNKKPIIEEKADRTVFNVENSLAATGGDAIDALKGAPGVTVMRNEISIAGKGTAGIMINGRLQQLSGQDLIQLLHSIPSGNIAKIEIINNPPARYDAEGNAGLINLVLKKNLKNGLKGSTTASYQYASIASSHLNTQINYKKDKLSLTSSIGAGIDGEKYTNRTTSYPSVGRCDQSFVQYERDKNASLQLNTSYQLSPRHTIGLSAAELLNFTDATNTGRSANYSKDILDSTVLITGELHDRSRGKHTLNVNYEWQIDSTGKKLNVDADYYQQQDERKRNYISQVFSNTGTITNELPDAMDAEQGVIVKSVKADAEWPLKTLNLSFGAKASAIDNTSYNVYRLFSNNAFVIDGTRSNDFQYKEQNQAAYVSGQRSFKKLDVQLGIRTEHSLIQTYSPNTGDRHKTKYTKMFPSAYIQYKLNDKNVIGLTSSRRINRPGYNSLNPFRFYMGSNFYMTGNPDLKPSFTDAIDVSYRWKSNYGLRIFARNTQNYSDRIFETDSASSTTIMTRANMGTASTVGACITAQHSLTKWWDIRGSITIIHQDYSLNFYNSHTRLKDEFEWGDMSNTFYLKKDKSLSAEIYCYYYSPRNKDYKKWSSMSTLDVNVRWLLFNKNLVLALHLEDLMARAYWQQNNIINGTSEYSYDNSRGGRISATYKFGNKNIKVREPDHLNEDIQRANAQ
jgi:outer membrane receptor protein involved in Fe transport